MALNAGSVYVDLQGKFNPAGFVAFDRRLKQSTSNTQRASSLIGKSMLGVGALVAVGLGKSVQMAAEYESSLKSLQAVTGATAKQMEKISAKAKALGKDLSLPGTSAADAAKVMEELAKGGFTVEQSMKAAKGAILLANAAEIDGAQAAKIVTKQINAFHLAASDATRVSDVLAASANATSSEMPEMAQALQMVAAVAAQAGMSLEETVGTIGMLSNAGIAGSDAGTSLKTMLMNLSKPTADAQYWMEKMNVDMYDAKGRFVGVRDAVKQYSAGLKRLNPEQQDLAKKAIFGSDAIRSANIIFGQGVKKYDAMTAAMKSNGQAAALGKAKMSGLKGAYEGIKSTVETMAINLGEKLLPVLTDAAGGISDFMTEVADSGNIEKFGETVANTLVTLGEVGGVIGGAAVSVGKLAASVGLLNPTTLTMVGTALALFKLSQVAVIAGTASSLMGFAKALAVLGAALPAIAGSGMLGFATATAALKPKIMGLIGSINPLVVAAGVAAGAIGLLTRSKRQAAEATRAATEAETAHAAAIKGTDDAAMGVVDSELAANSATEERARLQREVNRLEKQGKTDTDAYKQAKQGLKQATVDEAKALQTQIDAAKEFESAQKAQLTAAETRYKANLKQIQNSADGFRDYEDVIKKVQGENYKLAVSQARVQVAEANISRLRKGEPAILGKAADAAAKYVAGLGMIPKEQKLKMLVDDRGGLARLQDLEGSIKKVGGMSATPQILADDREAKGKILDTARQLKLLGAQDVAAKILVSDQSAKQKLSNLLSLKKQLAGSVQFGLNVVQHVKKRAAGRRRGGSEDALVGEGGGREIVISGRTGEGFVADRPMFTSLGSDDYVIPTESKYRGRGKALLAAAAADLGVSSYARGRRAAGSYDPQKLEGVVSELEQGIDSRKSELDSLRNESDSKKKAKSRGKRAKLVAEIRQRERTLTLRRRELAKVKAYELRQTAAAELGQVAETKQQLAELNQSPAGQLAEIGKQEKQLKAVLRRDKKSLKTTQKGSRRQRELMQRKADTELKLKQLADQRKEISKIAETGGGDDVALADISRRQAAAADNVAAQINIQKELVSIRSRMFEAAVKAGDKAGIVEAQTSLEQSQRDLSELEVRAAENNVRLAEARAATTKTLADDVAAAHERLNFQQAQLKAAEQTGDAGKIADALTAVTQASGQLADLVSEQTDQLLALAAAQANATISTVDDVAVANRQLALARERLASAQAAGDIGEQTKQTEAVNQLLASIDDLTTAAELNVLRRDQAAAALTAQIADDKNVQARLKAYWEGELAEARKAGDIVKETTALTELKSASEAVTQLADAVQAELSKFFSLRRDLLQTFGSNLVAAGSSSRIVNANFTNNFSETTLTADQVSRSLIFDLSGIQ